MIQQKNKMIIILCTLPDKTPVLSQLIKTLLHQKLAACISTNKIHSFYYWNDDLQNHTEIQLFIKTKNSLQKMIFKKIKEMHPYKIPELLILPISNGDPNYLTWMKSTLL